MEATVTATAEISVLPFDARIQRQMNEPVGLPLIGGAGR
jgi:hypothetical protein